MSAAVYSEYNNDNFDDAAGFEPRQRRGAWVTHPFAELINSLCPISSYAVLREFEWLDPHDVEALADALRFGFNFVEDDFERHFAEYLASDGASLTGARIIQFIKRKTFPFGKLFEAITLPTFINGPRGSDGTLQKIKKLETVVTPELNIDKSNLEKAIIKLVASGVIDRAPSNWQSQSGSVAYVYCVVPILPALTTMTHRAFDRFDKARPDRASGVFDQLTEMINGKWSAFQTNVLSERERASERIAKAAAKKVGKSVQRVAAA
ncbi:hypothetical protein HGP14_14670 [Rhizobium sp. P32RR-XVIII]|uniref:hypothetical protein n=1 Tax=Rhizobium sp. P32RR-XVIII TaxID=2726738 RepID=UPI0014579712|nr:hypothetical protein [Rhizobium sp. P32RR-XVIII]NLS04599.1 hypothetical protein [Rhizobium sp. P32RR-XVIII]